MFKREKLDKVKQQIDNIHKEFVSYYDPTQYHFNIGDYAWVWFNDDIYLAKITEVDDFSKNYGSDGYVFYWFQLVDIKWYEKVFYYLSFYLWLLIFRHFKFKQPKINPKFGAGHAVLGGRNETLFKTQYEAVLDNYFQEIKYCIDEITFGED